MSWKRLVEVEEGGGDGFGWWRWRRWRRWMRKVDEGQRKLRKRDFGEGEGLLRMEEVACC